MKTSTGVSCAALTTDVDLSLKTSMHKQQHIPAVMFHSIGADRLNWPYRFLSEDIGLFEQKIDYLIERGWSFIHHEDLYAYMARNKPLPPQSLMLTFDDGYLDNWVVVFPILKKRGVRFTIYVSQEFVDPSGVCRPTLDDVWAGRCTQNELQILGYLSWAEMRAMESSGLADIQSHTSTHTWHFTGSKVLDFFHPGNAHAYPWIVWNHSLEMKYSWPRELRCDDLWGLPVYEHRRSMDAWRYHEDSVLAESLKGHVSARGGAEYFSSPVWREELMNIVRRHQYNGDSGRMESPTERHERLMYELAGNRVAIEKALDKDVLFLCWPGGAYSDELIGLASDCGYLASTVKLGRNSYGDDPRFVYRISSGNPSGAHRFPWKFPLFTLRFYMDRFQGKTWAMALDRIYRMTGNQ
jgi:peptidoglycan/xylan/chitin deacetylase (PgdA/CDA1 family)